MIERRFHPRLRHTELIMICWEENSTKSNQIASVRDVSPGGIAILAGQALPVGTPVTITCGKGELTGIVRHNSQLVDGNCMGIEFADAEAWGDVAHRTATP